jgi:hypothetical protein
MNSLSFYFREEKAERRKRKRGKRKEEVSRRKTNKN